MFLEINDKLTTITAEMIRKEFPNLVGSNPYRVYIFKYVNIIKDKDNPGKELIPFDYIPNTFTGTWNDSKAKFRYFRTKREQGIGKEPIYAPDTWCFDRTGQLIIDLSENAHEGGKDYALVYFLLKCPQYGQIFYLVNHETESANRVTLRALKVKAMSIITDTSNAGYLDLNACIRLAKKLQISNADGLEEFQLRDILSAYAEGNPKKVMETVSSEEGRIIEVLQEAEDYKVIHYDHATHSYFYTMREDTAKPYAKVTIGEPFYVVTPNFWGDRIGGLEKFVTLHDNALKTITDLLRDEKAYLNLIPTKANQKAIHLVKQVTVELSKD